MQENEIFHRESTETGKNPRLYATDLPKIRMAFKPGMWIKMPTYIKVNDGSNKNAVSPEMREFKIIKRYDRFAICENEMGTREDFRYFDMAIYNPEMLHGVL